jgi:ABC-type transport system substrate-binding protein
VLERREGGSRPGNVARVEVLRATVPEAVGPYAADQIDIATVRYTPRLADLVPDGLPDLRVGSPTWSGYLAFDHLHPLVKAVEVRQALAHAVDRDAVAAIAPVNLVVATGGIVPPALQGHTPDITLRFDPDRARALYAKAGAPTEGWSLAFLDEDLAFLEPVLASWREVLGLDIEARPWTRAELATMPPLRRQAPIYFTGWLPGYADPEYFLRLLFQSDSRTNEGGFHSAVFDDLIERARQERSDRGRLQLFHEADRFAVADQVAVIPLVYGRSFAMVKPWVDGWWEFGKSSANFADLVVRRP